MVRGAWCVVRGAWPENKASQPATADCLLPPAYCFRTSAAIITPVLHDPPLTKRQLGALCLGAGALLAVATLAADLVGAGRFGGLGPAQQQALGGGGALILFGLSLLPLGHRPA